MKDLLTGIIALIISASVQAMPETPLANDENTVALYHFNVSEPDSATSATFGTDSADNCMASIRLDNGTMILGGYSASLNRELYLDDILLIWISSDLQEICRRTYARQGFQQLSAMCLLSAGEILLLAKNNEHDTVFVNRCDILLMKLDLEGEIAWSKILAEDANPMALATDGESILVGAQTRERAVLYATAYKFDLEGNIIWSRVFGNQWTSGFWDIDVLSDSTYMFSGNNLYFGRSHDPYFVRITADGEMISENHYGDERSETAYSLIKWDSLLFSCGASMAVNNGYSDYYVQCADLAGNLLWSNTYTHEAESVDFGYHIIRTVDQNLLICGKSGGLWDEMVNFTLLKLNPAGRIIWSKRFYGSTLYFWPAAWQEPNMAYTLTGVSPERGNDFIVLRTLPDIPLWWDYSGQQHHGAVWGNITPRAGLDQEAGLFGADSGSAMLIAPNPLCGLNEWTMEFFFLPMRPDTGCQCLVFSIADDSSTAIQISIDADRELIKCFLTSSESQLNIEDEIQLYNGEWHYIALWYEGQTAGLYLDDYLIQGEIDGMLFADGNLILGQSDLTQEDMMKFNGLIDEFRISNVVRDYLRPNVVANKDMRPSSLSLHAPFPSPFNSIVRISFDLPQSQKISLVIYDLSGRKLVELDNGYYLAGSHTTTFNANNLACGMYIVRLQSNNHSVTAKLLLTK